MMTQRPHYHGHRSRLREKLLKEPTQLADYEVLELLLGMVLTRQDTKPLAKELLARLGTVRGVLEARPQDLLAVEGVGSGVVAYWALLAEVRARFVEASVRERVVFSSPRVVADMALARLGGCATEEFWVALVDNKSKLLAWERLSQGTVDQSPVYPREILSLALAHKARGVVLVHNHPGGDPRPSAQDLEITARIVRAAKELDILVHDHIIVAGGIFFSFKAQDKL